MKLNLGCGERNIPGYINVDIHSPNADIQHDLNTFPYPFKKDSIDFILMADVLEHLQDPLAVLRELYRILKPGGKIRIYLPHFSYHGAYNPFHRTFWSYNCVFYETKFDRGDSQMLALWKNYTLLRKKLIFTERLPKNFFKKTAVLLFSWHRYLLSPLFNRYPIFLYESSFLRSLVPCYKIMVEIKKDSDRP